MKLDSDELNSVSIKMIVHILVQPSKLRNADLDLSFI